MARGTRTDPDGPLATGSPRRVRRAAAPRGAPVRGQTRWGRVFALLHAIGLDPARLRRLVMWGVLLAVVAGGVGLARWLGVGTMLENELAAAEIAHGLVIRHVPVTGTHHMAEAQVDSRVGQELGQALTRLDLAAVRRDLLALPWVADARVTLRFPDTILTDVVERVPKAVLRSPDGNYLVDGEGHHLERIAATGPGEGGLIWLSGNDVLAQYAALEHLLAQVPSFRPYVVAAEWRGRRHWVLTLRAGSAPSQTEHQAALQTLSLPEDDENDHIAAGVLLAFVHGNMTNRYVGGNYAGFVMSADGRLYVTPTGCNPAVPNEPCTDAPGHELNATGQAVVPDAAASATPGPAPTASADADSETRPHPRPSSPARERHHDHAEDRR